MEVAFTEFVTVTDPSSVGEVRRTALLAAQRLHLDETRSGELALLATEASRNALVHGGGGQVVLTGTREHQVSVARILVMDKGPGIPNMAEAMSDGYSTSGTMGGGMGAMKRIANILEIFTGRSGTIVLLQIGQSVQTGQLQIAGLAVPYPGEKHCGDAWTCHRTPERTVCLLVDGLGHGWDASEAAREAVVTFHKRVELAPGHILSYVHEALRKTRGAVAAVVEIRPRESSLTYAGVGNISAVVLSRGTSRSLVSHNGTLGVATSRIQEFKSEWPADGVLVLHSDGLQSRWDLSPYAGLLARHPAVIGGALLRDFRRHRDDASVVVIKAA
ncbi:MAG TPA: SpoIIE family protein phosphatase [Terracidiphilus sp.]|jgi:anti-sigma regulatory factor (Ser/Thr protein kinase)